MAMAGTGARPVRRGCYALPLLLGCTLLCTLLGLGIGAVSIPPLDVLAILARQVGLLPALDAFQQSEVVLVAIRLPRVVLGVMAGAVLAVAGAAIQGLFRNPLADPGLVGVAPGAAFGAVAAIVFGTRLGLGPTGLLGPWLLPLAAFLGGLVATLVVSRIATREGNTDVTTMLLAGIAVNAVAMAGVGLFLFASDDRQLREATFWMMGSLAGVSWHTLLPALLCMAAPLLLLPFRARALNALLLGEADAFHSGFDVERTKRAIVVLAALGTGAAVALSGVIGFVGLIAPHLARSLVGPDHRRLLPAAACVGACLMLLADLVARTVVVPAELPIGVLTSGLGGPFFIWLLARRRIGWGG